MYSPYSSVITGSVEYTNDIFHHKYLTKIIVIFVLVYHVDWYKLTSKPFVANSGTFANTDQGSI